MKRILCTLLLLCLLSGCTGAFVPSWSVQYDGGGPATATIAYVPLDDRPINTTRVEILARAAGFRLIMPEKHLYRTVLDGQPHNPNGTQYGDGEALLHWLETTCADYYILSLDQILSGGLVNSRQMTTFTHEPQKISRLLLALEGKQVILLDTLMRLAPTVGYGGCTLTEYQALRAYGQLPRPTLSGKLTTEQVIGTYEVPTDLDPAVVSQYLAARSRKLRISQQLLLDIAHRENIVLYYGIDDSSPGNTIQTNEIAFLKQHLEKGSIFAGTDEMGLLAVTRVIRDHYSSQPLPTVVIRYFGADPDAPADAYDIGALKNNVESHLEALGIASAPVTGDLELLIFGGEDPDPLLAHYRENMQKGIPTMLVDLGAFGCLPAKIAAAENMDFHYLLSYSAWNTAGNAIGIALSNGVSRYLYLKNHSGPVSGSNSAFLEGLGLSFAKDISYRQAKPNIERYIEADPGNFYSADMDSDLLEQTALGWISKGDPLSFSHFAQVLEGKSFLTSLSPEKTAPIPHILITDIHFPWYRTFEAELRLQIGT